jgi:hypothetical protein
MEQETPTYTVGVGGPSPTFAEITDVRTLEVEDLLDGETVVGVAGHGLGLTYTRYKGEWYYGPMSGHFFPQKVVGNIPDGNFVIVNRVES